MSRKMLIDAAHPEETRVVVVNANQVEDFDFESASRKPIRGNIYLAKVTRVEPSLQAAFVEYGGNKHGFLAFNEIHPDYYQIPVEDREELRKAEAAIEKEVADAEPSEEDLDENAIDGSDADEIVEEASRKRRQLLRKYKIQEVIKRRQVLLVQVAKEERGNKGAALTTYMSLAGRYCVLMPNTARGGGISRKITQAADRKRLKSAVSELSVPAGMGLIIRTAGASRTKTEIKRDYDYLIRLWETIREQTLKSTAPSLIYEEGDLVKRAIRDLYDKDIEQVLVEGDEAYKQAKGFMKMLMPSHAKKVQHYKDDIPLYLRHQVESQLEEIHSPVSQLKSGGYLVINPTEALVSVDVNSGRSTKERNIEQTALRTNLEAAEEVARQMRLRDLAGLIVIDFIDMEENKNNRHVEKKMRDALKKDRSRIQMSRISQFGLMEISRQRRRTSLVEGSTESCAYCGGTGYRRSVESSALFALRSLEEEGVRGRSKTIALSCPADVALYLLNEKRDTLRVIEERYSMKVLINVSETLLRPGVEIERIESHKEAARAEAQSRSETAPVKATVETEIIESEDETETSDNEVSDESEEDRPRKRRRRGRRGGRGRRRRSNENRDNADEAGNEDSGDEQSDTRSPDAPDALQVIDPSEGSELAKSEDKPKRRTRRRKKPEPEAQSTDTGNQASDTSPEPQSDETADSKEEPEKKPRRRVRKKAEPAEAASTQDVSEASEDKSDEAARPKRSRRRKAPVKDAVETQAEETAKPQAGSEANEDNKDEPSEPSSARPKRKTTRKAPAKAASTTKSRAKTSKKPANDSSDKSDGDGSGPSEPSNNDDESKRKGWWSRSKKLFGSES